ncbi:MAG: cupredoxin domain-containing protein [Thermoleophilaceae bacterium]
MPRSIDRALALLGAALVIATGGVALAADTGGGNDDHAASAGSDGAAVKTSRVEIKDFKYIPPAIEVKAGTKVTFVNDDTANHTATSSTAGAFDTDRIERGKSKSVTLDEAGEFAYICAYHPFMKATIRVVE